MPDASRGWSIRGARRRSVRRLFCWAVAAVFAGVTICAAVLLQDRIAEELDLRTIRTGSPREQAEALARLLERGSVRAMPHLLEQVLDPALEGRLESTIDAIELLPVERLEPAPSPPRGRWGMGLREISFEGVDRDALEFLRSPDLQPAVRFGCVVGPPNFEDALAKALRHGDLTLRAQALALLLRVRSPGTVEAQREALTDLARRRPGRTWDPILSRMEACFAPGEVLPGLEKRPRLVWSFRTADFAEQRRLEWSIRAAGVMKLVEAIPQLRELSVSYHGDTSRAAERSLEDLEGPEADEALGHCLLAWRYDAYVRAGSVLAERNKPYLRDLLSTTLAPPDCRYWQAILLARCDSAVALPLLVSEVGKIAMIDGEMFEHIERLARTPHRDLIESLPGRVRPDQAEEARRVVGRFNDRFPIEHGLR